LKAGGLASFCLVQGRSHADNPLYPQLHPKLADSALAWIDAG